MAIIAGRQGRPTAGVSWNTSSVAARSSALPGTNSRGTALNMLRTRQCSPPQETVIWAKVRAMEQRTALSGTASGHPELGPAMFDGYPRYVPGGTHAPGSR